MEGVYDQRVKVCDKFRDPCDPLFSPFQGQEFIGCQILQFV